MICDQVESSRELKMAWVFLKPTLGQRCKQFYGVPKNGGLSLTCLLDTFHHFDQCIED